MLGCATRVHCVGRERHTALSTAGTVWLIGVGHFVPANLEYTLLDDRRKEHSRWAAFYPPRTDFQRYNGASLMTCFPIHKEKRYQPAGELSGGQLQRWPWVTRVMNPTKVLIAGVTNPLVVSPTLVMNELV